MWRSSLTVAHRNVAAESAGKLGNTGWAHICMGNPVPPTRDGSYTHLLWQLAQRRSARDVVVCDYFPDSFAVALRSEVPVVQISRGTPGLCGRLLDRVHTKAARVGLVNPPHRSRPFLEEAARVVRACRRTRVVMWDSLGDIRLLRQLLPTHTIAFAQRHFDYPSRERHYNYCDLVIMQTRGQLQQAFRQMGSLSPLAVVIPNGVELDLFRPPDPLQKATIRARYGLAANEAVALFPSKLAPHKGSRYLQRWVQVCSRQGCAVQFLVVGGLHHSLPASHRDELEFVLSSHRNVKWLPGVARAEMPDLYRAADFCLMPALCREGFSMSAVEALASGLPVIAPDSGCYPEIIRNGHNGVLCPQENLLRDGYLAITRLAADSAAVRRMSANARTYAEYRLSREKVLANFEAALEGDYERIDDDLSFPTCCSREAEVSGGSSREARRAGGTGPSR